MALYTKSQLAKLLGKPISWVSTYASESRKKIIMRGKYIDDAIPQNAEFIEKWLEKKVENDATSPGIKNNPSVPPPTTPEPPPIDLPENWEENPDELEKSSTKSIDRAAKIIEIKRKQSVIALSDLKAQKMRGESIPTDLVMDVFSMLGKELTSSYKDAAINFIMELSHKLKLSPEAVSELRAGLMTAINTSQTNAITQTKHRIKSLLNETAQMIANEPNE